MIRTVLRRVLILTAIVAGMGVLSFCIALGVVLQGMTGSGVDKADCGIVFGAGVLPLRDKLGNMVGSVAGPALERRTQTAAGLYAQGKLKKLILTGGKGEGMRRSEAAVMRDVAVNNGVDPVDIITEEQSTSTRENLLFSRPLTKGCQSVLAISDAFHLSRIHFLAWQQGWNLPTYPVEETINPRFETWSIVRETLGILFYSVY